MKCVRCTIVRVERPRVVCEPCARRPLRALSLWQPWADAVARHGKDVENRPRPPPASLRGDLLAIQASLRVDPAREAADAARIFDTTGVSLVSTPRPRGALVAVVRVRGLFDPQVTPRSPWWIGPLTWDGKPNRAWALGEVFALPAPIPQKGRQGVWSLDASVGAAVWQAWAEAWAEAWAGDARGGGTGP